MSVRYAARSRPGTMVSTWLNGLVSGTVPPDAWMPLQSSELGSGQAEVTFTSAGSAQPWSQFQDLVVIVYARSDRAGTWTDSFVRVNNMSSSGDYGGQDLSGNGSGVTASVPSTTKGGLWYLPNAGADANVFGCCIYEFFDINSGKYKSFLTQAASEGGTENLVWMVASTAKTTDPITEIDVITTGGDFIAGSRFDLFGVAA